MPGFVLALLCREMEADLLGYPSPECVLRRERTLYLLVAALVRDELVLESLAYASLTRIGASRAEGYSRP